MTNPLRSLALAALLGCSSACRTTPSPEAEVLGLLEAQAAAWNRGALEEFVELGYWRSPELCFYSGGTITLGYEPLVARYRERYAESREGMGQLSFSELDPIALGDEAALLRGRWRLERPAGEPIGGLFTLLLRRIEGEWRIVHDHTSSDE